jgi:predicted permease
MELIHERHGPVWLERIWQDLRYAFRQLRRNRIFAATVIGTLAIGIGAAIAMFTVVDQVLLRPLPYENASRLIDIKEAGKEGIQPFGAPYLDIQQWSERSHTAEIAFYNDKPLHFLEGDTTAVQVIAPQVSTNLFAVLGVHPSIGRGFDESTADLFARSGKASSVVLSDSAWREVFGADPGILGRPVKIDGDSYTVVGVMPRGFSFPFDVERPLVWTPMVLGDRDSVRVTNLTPSYRVIARLKAGATLHAAQAELMTIQADVAMSYTDPIGRERATSVSVKQYGDTFLEDVARKALLALFAASGLLWLIACVNTTNVLLARAMVRQREIAVRGALGASRWRILQQLVIEGLLLSSAGCLFGFVLSEAAVKLFDRELSRQLHTQISLRMDLSLILAMVGLTLLTAMLSSILPSLSVARAPIEPVLRQGGFDRPYQRKRGLLVVVEVALSLTLLVGCGLLLRTIYALRHVPLGFRTEHVVVAGLRIPAYEFQGRDMTTQLYEPLIEKVQQLPGVQAATLMTEVPLGNSYRVLFAFGSEDAPGNGADALRRRKLIARFRAVGPEAQEVFGFRIYRGRYFNRGDTAGSEPVVVVNRAFAKAYLGEQQPSEQILGTKLLGYEQGKQAAVVGILDDVRQVSIVEDSQPEVQVCIPQITPKSGFYGIAEGRAMDVAVRTDRSPSSIVPELRRVLREASPDLTGTTFTTMEQVVEDSYGSQRMAAQLLLIFGGSALLLCGAGLYGLMAYLVTQRTRELGLRMALGASRSNVTWLVVKQASWMLIIGATAGLILSYYATRALAGFLYGITPHDRWTLAGMTLLLLATGLVATLGPAKRAASLNPVETLRAE